MHTARRANRPRPSRRFVALPLVLLVAFAAIVPAIADDTKNGWLSVSIEPTIDAPISVDGVVRNTGAINRLELPPGEHWVTFGQVDGFAAPSAQQVTVVGNETTRLGVRYEPAGVLEVSVTPEGIEPLVSVDGVSRDIIGTTIAVVPGETTVCGEPVTGFVTPRCQRADVSAGVTARATLAYELPSTDDEVVASPRVSEGLVALYEFDDGSDTTITDSAGVVDGMDLTIADPAATTWSEGTLTFDQPTIATTAVAPTGLYKRVQTTGEFTIEAWIKPANLTQNGPARILSVGKDTSNANVVIGQGSYQGGADLIEARHQRLGDFRLSTAEGTLTTALTHVVATRADDGTVTVYIDGQAQGSRKMEGDPSKWDTSYRLALGAELDESRYWLGTYHLIALYDTALTPDQITTNYAVGPTADTAVRQFEAETESEAESSQDAGEKPRSPSDWRTAFDSRDIDIVRGWYRENTGHEAQGYSIEDLEYVGHLTTEYDGQVIAGVHAASIRIAHDDVTVRNSRITSAGGSGSYGLAYQNTWGQENGGTLVEFVTFDGWNGDVGNVNHAVYLSSNESGATVRRVNISGYSSGVSMRANTSFEESWVHHLYRGEGTGHGTSSTIRGPHNAAVRNLLEGPGGSSALSLYADHGGALHNALVEHNVMNDGRPHYQINAPNREYSSTSENVRVRHNRFGPAANSPHIAGRSNFTHPTTDFRDNEDL